MSSKKNNIPKEGFKVPEGYFEGFYDRLQEKKDTHFLPEEDGFSVPDGYFDRLADEVMDKVKESPKVVALHSYRKYYYAISGVAAALVLFFGIRAFLNAGDFNLNQEMEALASEDITNYLSDQSYQLDSYAIAEVMDMETMTVDDMLDQPTEEDRLFEYLDEQIDLYNQDILAY